PPRPHMMYTHPPSPTAVPRPRHPDQVPRLPPAAAPAIHDPPVHLLDAVAIHRIVENKSEIGEQIQPVILGIQVRKGPAPSRRIIVRVEPARPARCFSSFRRINGAKPVQGPLIHGPKGNFA